MKLRLVVFLGSLGTGGAERQFSQLCHTLALAGHDVHLVTLIAGGQNWDWLVAQQSPVKLSALSTTSTSKLLFFIQLWLAPWKLRRYLKRHKIRVLYSALYLSNLIALLACFRLKQTRLVWGIRASNIGMNWQRAIPFKLSAWLSRFVPLMVSNSYAGLLFHQNAKFRTQSTQVIPNGINVDRFYPDPEAGLAMRQQLGLSNEIVAIGLIGRLDPMKDHANFLQAAKCLVATHSHLRFICFGAGKSEYTSQLKQLTDELALGPYVIWAGAHSNMNAVYNAMDIVCSSSAYGEGFPNVIGEAMACAKPCVVTDNGDSARIVEGVGISVPIKDPKALADGLSRMLAQDYKNIGQQARQKIQQHYTAENTLSATRKMLEQQSAWG